MSTRCALTILVAFLLPACRDGDDDGGGSGSAIPAPASAPVPAPGPSPGNAAEEAQATSLRAPLGGGQEVPAVASFGRGTSTFLISAARDQVDYTLSLSNLGGVLGARVHAGGLGGEGRVLFDLSTASRGTLRAADLEPGAGGFGKALDAMTRGNAYVSVRTLDHPDGEIRGQIGPVTLRARLDGSSLVPPFPTPGSGTATISLNGTQDRMTFTVEVDDLLGPPIGAGIYVAPPGQNGPPILELSTTAFDSPLQGALTADDLRPKPEAGVLTFDDAVRALLSGNTFVKVRTTARPAGELRGQLGTRRSPPSSSSNDEEDDADDDRRD